MGHYFDFKEADPRDDVLRAAKKLGAVPETCLLNGTIAMGLHYEGVDPCARCPGPRERCEGRPMESFDPIPPGQSAREVAGLTAPDDATYRAINRKRQIQIMNEGVKEKEVERE